MGKIQENTTEIKDYNYIISHNKLIFVDKIESKEIRAGGKYSYGVNYETGETAQVLDKDYWKSAELMRSLVEEENYTPLWKKLLFLLIITGAVGFVWFIAYMLIPTAEKPVVNKTPLSQKIEIIPKLEQKETINNNISNPVIQKDSLSVEILKRDYDIESMGLEINRIMEEKNILISENFELTGLIEEKDIKIKNLEEKLLIYSQKPKDLTQEAFLMHLGTLVYERCEKTELETENNNCKELYYNYVKND